MGRGFFGTLAAAFMAVAIVPFNAMGFGANYQHVTLEQPMFYHRSRRVRWDGINRKPGARAHKRWRTARSAGTGGSRS